MPNLPTETRDTTIADLHAVREQLSDQHGGNIRAILEDARRRQAASGKIVLSPAALAIAQSQTQSPQTAKTPGG